MKIKFCDNKIQSHAQTNTESVKEGHPSGVGEYLPSAYSQGVVNNKKCIQSQYKSFVPWWRKMEMTCCVIWEFQVYLNIHNIFMGKHSIGYWCVSSFGFGKYLQLSHCVIYFTYTSLVYHFKNSKKWTYNFMQKDVHAENMS